MNPSETLRQAAAGLEAQAAALRAQAAAIELGEAPAASRSDPDPLLDAQAVAERLGLPRQRVWQLGREGALPCVRIGRQMRFASSVVDRFAAEGCEAIPT